MEQPLWVMLGQLNNFLPYYQVRQMGLLHLTAAKKLRFLREPLTSSSASSALHEN
eukprot:gene24324-29405_t